MKSSPPRRTAAHILIVSGISLFFFLMVMKLGHVHYESNDDLTLNLVAAGAYGPSLNTIYMNRWFISLLRKLFEAFPAHNWYLYTFLGGNLAAITGFCLCITKRLGLPGTAVLTAAVNSLLAADFYADLQFTKNAALYSAAGFLLLADLLYEETGPEEGWYAPVLLWRFLQWMAACAFLLAGLAVRKESFKSVLPFGAVLLLFSLRGKPLRAFRRALLPVLLPAALLTALFVMDRNAYRTSPQWRSYLAFNSARSNAVDYGKVDGVAYMEQVTGEGFSKNDLDLLYSWTFADHDVFTPEKLNDVAAIRDRGSERGLRIDPDVLSAACRQIRRAIRGNVLPVCVLALLVSAFFVKGVRSCLFMLFMMLFLAGEEWYLVCMDRAVWRAEYGIYLTIFLAGAGVLLRHVRPRCGTRLKGFCAFLGVLVFALIETGAFAQVYLKDHDTVAAEARRSANNSLSFFDHLRSQPGNFYILGTETCTGVLDFRDPTALTGRVRDMFENSGFTGGWAGDSPTGRYFFRKKLGEKEPLAALADGAPVYLAADKAAAGRVLRYLQEHYDPDLGMHLEDTVGNVDIWSFGQAAPAGEKKPARQESPA